MGPHSLRGRGCRPSEPALSARGTFEAGIWVPPLVRPLTRPLTRALSRQMLFADPPDHTRLRGLANKAFSPRVVEGMEARIREIAGCARKPGAW